MNKAMSKVDQAGEGDEVKGNWNLVAACATENDLPGRANRN